MQEPSVNAKLFHPLVCHLELLPQERSGLPVLLDLRMSITVLTLSFCQAALVFQVGVWERGRAALELLPEEECTELCVRVLSLTCKMGGGGGGV